MITTLCQALVILLVLLDMMAFIRRSLVGQYHVPATGARGVVAGIAMGAITLLLLYGAGTFSS